MAPMIRETIEEDPVEDITILVLRDEGLTTEIVMVMIEEAGITVVNVLTEGVMIVAVTTKEIMNIVIASVVDKDHMITGLTEEYPSLINRDLKKALHEKLTNRRKILRRLKIAGMK